MKPRRLFLCGDGGDVLYFQCSLSDDCGLRIEQLATASRTMSPNPKIPDKIDTGVPDDPKRHEDDYIIAHIDTMEESGLDRFGFVAFRAHFGDEGLWKRYQKRYHELVDEGIKSAPAACAEALSRIDDNIIVQFIDDSIFADQGPEGISSAFQICCLDEEVDDDDEQDCEEGEEYFQGMTPGVASNMCLMIDEECMRSVADETTSSKTIHQGC